MTERVRLENVSIVLHRPQIPENIGAAARAMRNMGLSRLLVVAPKNFDPARVRMMATQGASDIVEAIEHHGDLPTALGPFGYVACTTARLGDRRRNVITPETLARQLVEISRENRVAVVFGPEDAGLTNDEIRFSHTLVNIPTAEFSSLNLAQAVLVVCYELFRAGLPETKRHVPRLASRFELDAMYAQLADTLVKISYINPENPAYWVDNLRQFFGRYPLRAKEVAIIRGICRQIDWYGGKRHRDGRREKETENPCD